MIGTVTFDGLSQGQLWTDLTGEAALDAPQLVNTIGLLTGVALVSAFYALGVAGARSVGGDRDAAELRRAFVHSLVPIAMVYVAAHYLTFLLFEGQSIAYLASDPLGEGWDLFGTASAAIDYGALSQNQAWYLQVGFVVAGHVAALILAHDRALSLYPGSKLAVRSQYWMLSVMVGFTTLALWLLAAAQG
jgi:cytochrome bd-type quinol oxidase subunit 2